MLWEVNRVFYVTLTVQTSLNTVLLLFVLYRHLSGFSHGCEYVLLYQENRHKTQSVRLMQLRFLSGHFFLPQD